MSHQPPHELLLLAHSQSTIWGKKKLRISMCAWKHRYLEQITGTNTASMHRVERSQNHRRSSIEGRRSPVVLTRLPRI